MSKSLSKKKDKSSNLTGSEFIKEDLYSLVEKKVKRIENSLELTRTRLEYLLNNIESESESEILNIIICLEKSASEIKRTLIKN